MTGTQTTIVILTLCTLWAACSMFKSWVQYQKDIAHMEIQSKEYQHRINKIIELVKYAKTQSNE